jgi:hypothetical protein
MVTHSRETQTFIQGFEIGEIRGGVQPFFDVRNGPDIRQDCREILERRPSPLGVPETRL